jgi:hypothetical protein
VLLQRGAELKKGKMQEAGMRRECFVDGRPHGNGCVISAVLNVSHPFDVPKMAGMQYVQNDRSDTTAPCGLPLQPELLLSFVKWIPGATPCEAWHLAKSAQDVLTGWAREERFAGVTKLWVKLLGMPFCE